MTDIADLVIQDMHARKALGMERYGVPLRPHNGRDALQDAYEEALDLAVYLKQAMEERAAAIPKGEEKPRRWNCDKERCPGHGWCNPEDEDCLCKCHVRPAVPEKKCSGDGIANPPAQTAEKCCGACTPWNPCEGRYKLTPADEIVCTYTPMGSDTIRRDRYCPRHGKPEERPHYTKAEIDERFRALLDYLSPSPRSTTARLEDLRKRLLP